MAILQRMFSNALAGVAAAIAITASSTQATEHKPMDLGQFSVSLAVKDLPASLAFYERLGFRQVGGKLDQQWVVLQSGTARIGLFQGMFDKNLMTFNPGWSQDRQLLTDFPDVRELQRAFKARRIAPSPEADEATTGPAHFIITDPDGNRLMFDQHVSGPKR